MKTTMKLGLVGATLAGGMLLCAPARADDVLDDAEEVIETVNEFNGSECGKAIKGCWKDVMGAIRDTNKACKDFRGCKKKCRVSKRADKKACIADRCSGLRGKAEKSCKQSCKQGARLVKKSCVSDCGPRPAGCRSVWPACSRAWASASAS